MNRSSKKTSRKKKQASPRRSAGRNDPPERETLGRELLWALGLSALAAVHRVAFLFSNRDREWPFTVFYEGDAETFYFFARSILRGELYDAGIPFHPPGFAYFLAGIHTLLGAGEPGAQVPHLEVKIVLACISALSVGLLYLLVRPFLGRVVALVAALLATWHFGLYVISIATVGEGLYLTLLLAALVIWTRGLRHPFSAPGSPATRPVLAGVGLGVGLGVFLGAMALVRAESMLFSAVLVTLGLVGVWQERRQEEEDDDPPALHRRLLPWAAVVLVAALVVAPWTLRNVEQLEAANERLGPALAEPLPTFVPVTLYGPLNLALANHAEADGMFSPDLLASLGRSGRLQLTDPEHLELLLHGHRRAVSWIVENPGDFAVLATKKIGLFFRSLRLGWTQWNVPAGLEGRRNPVDIFFPHAPITAWLFAPLILAGFFLAWRLGGGPRRFAYLAALLTGLALLVTVFFFGYVRQGLLWVPIWSALAAVVPVRAAQELAHRGEAVPDHLPDALGRGAKLALGTLVGVLLVLALAGARADRNYEATGTTLPGSQKLNRDLPVELKPLPDDGG